MNKLLLCLFFSIIIQTFSFCQDSTVSVPNRALNLDFSMGIPTTSAAYTSNLRSLNRSIHYLIDDRISWMKRRDGKQMFLKATSRFLRYVVIDRQISFNMMLLNHEGIGHVASLANSNYKIAAYYQPLYLYLTPRYSKKIFPIFLNFNKAVHEKNGMAAVYFSINPNDNIHLTQRINIAASGVMAENLHRIDCQQQWVKTNTIPYADATLYIESTFDNLLYIRSANENGSGGDMGSYLFHLNLLYNPELYNNGNYAYDSILPKIEEKFRIKSKQFHTANYISTFSDPNLYFSLFAIGNYIIRGESSMKLPFLRIGKVKSMPTLSLVLAPFGLEYNLRSPLVFPNRKMHVNFRYGEAYGKKYYGMGLKIAEIVCKNDFVLSPHLEIFSQPAMYFGNSKFSDEPFRKIGGTGFIADVLIEKKFTSSPMYLSARIGYKTSGFVLGESLKATPIIQFGFGTELPTLKKKQMMRQS